MYTIKVDKERNRFNLTFTGIISVSEAKKARDAIKSEVVNMMPDFDVVNDFSNVVQVQEEAGPVLLEVLMLFKELKIRRIVRVVGDSKKGLMLTAKYTPGTDSNYIKYVPTLSAAESYLEEK